MEWNGSFIGNGVVGGAIVVIISQLIKYLFDKRKARLSVQIARQMSQDEKEREILSELWKRLSDLTIRLNGFLFNSNEVDSFGQLSEALLKEWENMGGVGEDGTGYDKVYRPDEKEFLAFIKGDFPDYQKFRKGNSFTPAMKAKLNDINAHFSKICKAAWETQHGLRDNGYNRDPSEDEKKSREEGKEAIKKQRKEAMTEYRAMIKLINELEKIIQGKIFPDDVNA